MFIGVLFDTKESIKDTLRNRAGLQIINNVIPNRIILASYAVFLC
jgi:hypothetical protein